MTDCPTADSTHCPNCGSELTPHYGFYGGYGLGGMDVCLGCGEVFNFSPDTEGTDND